MPTDPDDIHATCTAAADLIECDGWTRRTFWATGRLATSHYEPGVSLCILGALRAASGLTHPLGEPVDWATCAATKAVEDEVRRRLDEPGLASCIPDWNDYVAADAAEVVGLLRDVAAKHQPDAYRSGGHR